MANEQNLRPGEYKLTHEEQKKGGAASVRARRARKTLREELLTLLADGDTQQKISVALILEAINGNRAGSVSKAFETIRDTIGEKPVEKVMLSEVEPGVIEEVEKAVMES